MEKTMGYEMESAFVGMYRDCSLLASQGVLVNESIMRLTGVVNWLLGLLNCS